MNNGKLIGKLAELTSACDDGVESKAESPDPPVVEWVDVRDRLPEFGRRYHGRFRVMRSHRMLVACSDGSIRLGVGWRMPDRRNGVVWFDDSCDIIGEVTHWVDAPRHPVSGKSAYESDPVLTDEEWNRIVI